MRPIHWVIGGCIRRRLVGLAAFLGVAAPALQATVIVRSSLDLTQLQIVPALGSVQFLPTPAATASAVAQDSLGGFDSEFDSETGSPAGVTATAFLAGAAAAADPNALTASASSSINIPGTLAASALSTGQGTITLSFQITGTTGTVSVQLSAGLSGAQSLFTDMYGQQATSELIFNLLLPDVSSSPLLFYDNPLQIGPSQFVTSSYSNTLSDTISLTANQPYLLIAQVDAESSGLNTPEPASVWTGLAGIGLLCVLRRPRR